MREEGLYTETETKDRESGGKHTERQKEKHTGTQSLRKEVQLAVKEQNPHAGREWVSQRLQEDAKKEGCFRCFVVLVVQLYPTLCTWTVVYYSPPGSSVHGILQARILKWVAISFSRGSSLPRNQTWVSCIAGRFFTN